MDIETRTRQYVEWAMRSASAYEREKVIRDWLGKAPAARGLVEDFRKRAGDPARKRVLDVGFGNGLIAAAFVDAGAQVSGLEVSEELLCFAKDVFVDRDLAADLQLYDGARFPFADSSFEYVYSVSVLEHTDDPRAILTEAARVLTPGGKFYLAFPNRFSPKETHTGLWLISYLPLWAASWIARLFGRSPLDEYWNLHFLSFFTLRRMLWKQNIPFTIKLDRTGIGIKGIVKRLLAALGIHHSAILSHVMVVLEKK